ncbi:septum site-determining protein MinC [Azospira oryzae]|uniref:septum site-determining protein MinC n=1 Tax=Azospira oryzae TaxID=146939 RepID=UPI00196488D4|nr:septum site-determining protein MinC [Azospira oryzae]
MKSAPKSVPLLEIKGTTLAMTVLQAALRSADLPSLADSLTDQYGPSSDFFSFEPTVIDLGELPADIALDWSGLLPLLRRYQVAPIGVRNASPAQAEAARNVGLIVVEEAETQVRHSPRRAEAAAPTAAAAAPAQAELDIAPANAPANEAPAAAPAPAAAAEAAPSGTLVLDKPLRSGQQVYARGGDLVVLAMVSPGAEVIADGNIHIYAPLRGRALAGARGDANARIFTTCFEAELTSVAGVYRTFEPGSEKSLTGKPVQIRLEGEKLVLEALKTS